MVEIQSKEAIDKISDELKVQPSMAIGRKLSENVQMTYDIAPKRVVDVVDGTIAATTSTATMVTTPTDRDFFLTGALMGFDKDDVCDGTSISIQATLFGKAETNIFFMSALTLVAQQRDNAMVYNPPIKLARGTTIKLAGAFTAGTMSKSASITGYTTDPQ